MPLSIDDIKALRSKPSTGSTAELYGGTKYFDGGEWKAGKVTPEMKGGFTGNQGSQRRSRKGRTYRAPNGSRTYHPWNPDEVQAYRI